MGCGINSSEVMSLALGDWVSSGHCILISRPTGAGKSWLACALAQYACRRGYSSFYWRVPRLQEELRIKHGIGVFSNWLRQMYLYWMNGVWEALTVWRALICWILLTTELPTKPPSLPVNYRLNSLRGQHVLGVNNFVLTHTGRLHEAPHK